MVGNNIPRWEKEIHGRKLWDFLLAYLASTTIHKGIHKGGPEFHFPAWDIISCEEMRNPTVGYHIPARHDHMLTD